jgi:PPOX class probable F420-dependent enzyme
MARSLQRDEALAFLAEGTRTGKLALGGGRGPIVVPVWFVVDGDELVFTTGKATAKGRRLRADPRAALCADDEAYPYGYVQVRGTVALAEPAPDELLPWTTRIAERYVPAGEAEAFGRRNADLDELLCRLRAERVVGLADVAD